MDRSESRQAIEEVLKNLTNEQKSQLQTCQRNGFIAGCVWGFTVHSLRQLAAQYNLIKKPTMGGNVGTFIVNAILGYITYTPICASRAIEPLVRKQMEFRHESGHTTDLPLSMEESPSLQNILTQDLDGPDSSFSSLSLNYDPNIADNLIFEDEEDKKKPKYQTTYEDLRRQNREGYKIKSYAAEGVKPPSQPARETPSKPKELPKRIKTNQYGDPIE